MSRHSDFVKSLDRAARDAGGSFKTVSDRTDDLKQFAEHCRENNIQLRDIEGVKVRHVQSYIEARRADGVGTRTIQNELSAIRTALAAAGRAQFAQSPELSNKALGVSGASRAGTHVAIPEDRLREAISAAAERDGGVAAALELARALGLRSEEAVQSCKSLATWERQLERGQERVTVVYGTKGGRPRETTAFDKTRALNAIRAAREITRVQGGKLIDRPNLKSAMARFHNTARAIGLTGPHSPHSLRYAYAQDGLRHYAERGFTRHEARALVSQDLGHGDGRGRYIAMVYGKGGEGEEV